MASTVLKRAAIAAPAVGPSDVDALVAAARELAPLLAARAPEGEANRRIADDLIDQVAEQGLFKVTQPQAYGGYGGTGAASVAVSQEIARGDGSVAWIMINYHAAMWAIGQMSEQAQDEVWGADPDARACTVTFPRGPGLPVPGGRTLNGIWPFGSGCLHAQWVVIAFMSMSAEGKPEGVGVALVPMADVTVKDDWSVSGFRGTGSNTLVLDNVFVPDHRLVSMADLLECRPAYEKADITSLYHGAALSSVFTVVAFGPLIGMGEAALAAFTSRLPGREVSNSLGAQQIDSQIVHGHIAETRMAIDVARLLAADCNAMLDRAATAGKVLTDDERARVRVSLSWSSRKVVECVQLLMADSGGRGIADSNPLARILRDLQAFHNHGIVNPFQTMAAWGAMLVGVTPSLILK